MKRQSILLILLLLQVFILCAGCGSSKQTAEVPLTAAQEAAVITEKTAVEEVAAPMEESEIIATQKATNAENVENVIGIFEGLEDNHTAIFSFDGAEEAFYFEDPSVQQVLYEAVLGSHYTLSYSYDNSLGYVIYEISE